MFDAISLKRLAPVHKKKAEDQGPCHEENPDNYYERELKSRPGRLRHTAIWRTSIEHLYAYFKREREEKGHNVFQIPRVLKDAAAVYVIWQPVRDPEQIIFDLRSDQDKTLISRNQPLRTIKLRTEVFETKPQHVFVTKSKSGTKREVDFRPSIHHLEKQSQIMFSSIDEGGSKIQLKFWTEAIPYESACKSFKISLLHFGAVMVVNDGRSKADPNAFKAVVYSIKEHTWPCVLLKFNRESA